MTLDQCFLNCDGDDALRVGDEFDAEDELAFASASDGRTVYLMRMEVRRLRDHLTAVLDEDDE